MPITQVKALLVSSKESDLKLIGNYGHKFQYSKLCLQYANNCSEAKKLLQSDHFDILLICGSGNDRSQQLLYDWLRHEELSIPATVFIARNRNKDHHQQQLLRSGAIDIIPLKDLSPALLERSIRYAIRHKADELRLLKLAHHDPLTGLSNRLAFKSITKGLMAQSRRSGDLLALMVVDLDNFKAVNDNHGHDAGDCTLIEAANLIQKAIRETDFIARLGGDEFAIVGTQLKSPNDAATLARHIIERCNISQGSAPSNIEVSCSIGVSIFPNDGEEFNGLLKHADNALLAAKQAGKQQFSFADQQLNLKDRFHHALDNDIKSQAFLKQLELHFQPILDFKQQAIHGAEALLRWNCPNKGLLTPEKFLDTVESNGLMDKVGNWVVHNACMQHLKWREIGLPAIPVCVNLTARQLENSYLINVIKKLINNQNFDPHYLCLEFSEGDAFHCSEKVFNSLYKLHELGVNLTIDNFGKEYCSLTQLHRLPIDSLKIDKSLIQRLEQNGDFAQVTEAIIKLGKILNLDVIAHGIESDACLDYLLQRDCHHAQGYHIAKPLNGEDFACWANNHSDSVNATTH